MKTDILNREIVQTANMAVRSGKQISEYEPIFQRERVYLFISPKRCIDRPIHS